MRPWSQLTNKARKWIGSQLPATPLHAQPHLPTTSRSARSPRERLSCSVSLRAHCRLRSMQAASPAASSVATCMWTVPKCFVFSGCLIQEESGATRHILPAEFKQRMSRSDVVLLPNCRAADAPEGQKPGFSKHRPTHRQASQCRSCSWPHARAAGHIQTNGQRRTDDRLHTLRPAEVASGAGQLQRGVWAKEARPAEAGWTGVKQAQRTYLLLTVGKLWRSPYEFCLLHLTSARSTHLHLRLGSADWLGQ